MTVMNAVPETSQSSLPGPVKFTLITSAPALTSVLAANLQAQVSANDALPSAPFEDMTVFHALEPPAISVLDYVSRVAKYAFCSEACLVAAFHYVNTAVEKNSKLALTSLSIHRLFITAIVLACKYFDDVSYNLLYYSRVGGLPYKELANLEVSLLRILDFRLDIPASRFSEIETRMVKQLDVFEDNPVDQDLSDLVAEARRELAKADIEAVELKCPSDDVDFAEIVAEHEKNRRSASKKPRSSPAISACTDDESTLSRNSSMASVTSSAIAVPVDEDRREDLNENPCTRLEEKHTVSPTTPRPVSSHHRASAPV